MKIFAISDLHLPGNNQKPMDIFGDHWTDHFEQISKSWNDNITNEDVVLIAGDISWAMDFSDVMDDLKHIGELPGKKIILRGNHDYWWQSISKVRNILPENMYALQNDSIRINDVVICGTRGWICPGSKQYNESEEKIYNREGQRLKLSLLDANKKVDINTKLIVMMHYPPFNDKQDLNIFTDQLEEVKPDVVIYGHLHGFGAMNAFEGNLRGVEYKMTACDYINFEPIQIL